MPRKERRPSEIEVGAAMTPGTTVGYWTGMLPVEVTAPRL
jgi:hypothetical protein